MVTKAGKWQQENPREVPQLRFFGIVVTVLTDHTILRFTILVSLVVEGPGAPTVEPRTSIPGSE